MNSQGYGRSIRAGNLAVMLAAMLFAWIAVPSAGAAPAGTHTEESCGQAAAAAPESCNTTTTVSAATGAVAAQTSLVSPERGTAPWKANADSNAAVEAPAFHVANPVRRLDFIVNVHVNQASTTLRGLRAAHGDGWPATMVSGLERDALSSVLGHWAGTYVLVTATHSQCSDCGGGTTETVLQTSSPGTVSTSDRDVVLQMSVTRAGGGNIPAGDLTVRAGVSSVVWQGNTWGDDSATIDAVVRAVSLQ